jgi:hypothetical protein
LQTKSQALPLQVAVAFEGVVHAAQTPLQSRCPGSHWSPQVVPQVAVPLGTVGQTSHEALQLSGLVFDTHAWPHTWAPAGHWQVAPLHEPPDGQSAGRRQPVMQRFERGSQK